MTNAEAIETLRANYPDRCFEQLRAAVDKAIKALEAQDATGDSISRQAAIKSITWHKGVVDKSVAKRILMQLPSAQPESIRCKDCLMHGVCRFEQGLGLDGYCSQAERRTDESN